MAFGVTRELLMCSLRYQPLVVYQILGTDQSVLPSLARLMCLSVERRTKRGVKREEMR